MLKLERLSLSERLLKSHEEQANLNRVGAHMGETRQYMLGEQDVQHAVQKAMI